MVAWVAYHPGDFASRGWNYHPHSRGVGYRVDYRGCELPALANNNRSIRVK
jgi:hypothetical protein